MGSIVVSVFVVGGLVCGCVGRCVFSHYRTQVVGKKWEDVFVPICPPVGGGCVGWDAVGSHP